MKNKKKQKTLIRRPAIILSIIFLFLCAIFIFYVCFLTVTVVSRCRGAIWDIPSKIYSSPMQIYSGIDLTASGFYKRLNDLGYRRGQIIPNIPGRFYVNSKLVYLYQRRVDFPFSVKARMLQIFHRNGIIIKIIDVSSGNTLNRLQLEPVEITSFYGKKREERCLVQLSQVPEHLINAVLAMEDRRFYEHAGLDFKGILRALYRNLAVKGVIEGGSTITQQLVKNMFLTPERTLWRKFNEAIMSIIIESYYSKDKILEIYFNEIYLGQKKSVEIHGVGEAARFYFGRSVEKLDLDQSAMLAGLIKAPNRYSPYINKNAAVNRRNAVLKTLMTLKKITSLQYKEAAENPLEIEEHFYGKVSAPYFVDYAIRQIHNLYPRETLNSLGLSIFTTLDVEIQKWAVSAVENGLKKLEKECPNCFKKNDLQAAVIVTEPATGRILAMVGGRNYSISQFNRATDAMRQPGSLIKPLVYAMAIKKGYTAVTILEDAPVDIKIDNKTIWSPSNFANKYYGKVPLIKALALSLNGATVKLAQELGFEKIYQLGHDMGLPDRNFSVPSFVLGACEVTPLEIARFYSIFSSAGFSSKSLSVRNVFDQDGIRLRMKRIHIKEVLSPLVCQSISDMLKCSTIYGTGKKLAKYGLAGVAGKTGTSNNGRDAWFAGYHNGYLTVVWVGTDSNQPAALTGSKAALPIWGEIMKKISLGRPAKGGNKHIKLFRKKICFDSGKLASPACPHTWNSVFINKKDVDNLEICPVHRNKKGDFKFWK